MITTYSRLLVVLLFSFAAASASSLRFIHPNDPSVEFSHGWSIFPSGASTTQPGASFNVVLPLGATRVVLLGSSSFHLVVCLDCRRHQSKIFSADANSDHSQASTVLFDLNVDPHINHVLTITNVPDPRLDATGKLSLDALVVATQQVARFVESNTFPWDLSSLFMNAGSLLEELGRIFPNPSSSNSAPLGALTTPTLPYSRASSNTGSTILATTPATPQPTTQSSSPSTTPSTSTSLSTSSPSAPLRSVHQSTDGSLTSPGTPTITPGSVASSPIGTDTGVTSLGSGTRSPSTRAMSKSTVAILVLISLFIFFSLILGGIALWMTRARRSKVAASRDGEEQANVDNVDRFRPINTISTAEADWLYGGRPPSNGSLYSDPHSPRPSEAEVDRAHWSVATSARLEAPPSMRELEHGRIAPSPPLSAHSLGSSSSGTHELEINNAIRRTGISG